MTVPRSVITRRGLLAGAATGAVGSMFASPAGLWAAAEPSVDGETYRDVEISADVLVVGAGAAGIPAAISAARQGAKVILLEEDPVPGGAPVDMSVGLLCGWPRVGIFREMVDRLQQHHHLLGRPVRPDEELRDTWFLPTSYLQVFHEMLSNETGVRLMCGARAVAPIVARRPSTPRVEGVVLEGPAGRRMPIKAKVTIDCTGSGALAEMAGCRCLYGRDARGDFHEKHARPAADTKTMPCTWMYVSQRFRQDGAKPMDFNRLRAKGVNESGFGWFGSDPEEFRRRDTGIYLHWGCTVACDDTRDPVALAKAQREAWNRIQPDVRVLFEHGYAVHLPPRLGVRECRRVVGEHVITEEDLKSGVLPADTVAIGQYYLDVWGEKLSEEERALPKFGIPYRALVPKGVDGLLVAGKIISGTHIAMSAYRVQPIVAQMGQAAGAAAAMAAAGRDTRGVSMDALRERLRAGGIPLP